ncbi:hypothetical protein SETIT_9G531700v2 [Setaria italica]|uniref:RRM domain-containing protein n=1 Tax=Setaria italica TaxID=4555 RepID=K4AJS4_SETIT|nr:hypothetical protein SETIT_9G531700v2 [Setaria italica]
MVPSSSAMAAAAAAQGEGELREHFARFGEVRSVIMMRDREMGHDRGFGFVVFKDEADAVAALSDGDKPRHFICGRMVGVKRARDSRALRASSAAPSSGERATPTRHPGLDGVSP